MLGRSIAVALLLTIAIAGQGTPTRRPDRASAAADEELRQLKLQAAEVDQRVRDLIRLRIAWDLLLPVREGDLLRGTVPVPATSISEIEQGLREEAERTRSLREQLARLVDSGRLVTEKAPAPPIAPRMPAPAPGGPAVARLPEPIEPLFRRFDLAPRREATPRPGPWRTLPIVVDPLASAEEPATRIEPTVSTWKRVASLVRARLPRQALVVIDLALTTTPDDAGLLFLRGRALEGLGLQDQARTAFERVRELDVRGSDNRPGPWSHAATLALAHMTWSATTEETRLPGTEGLSWQ